MKNPIASPELLAPEDQNKLDQLITHLHGSKMNLAGYPCNQMFNYDAIKPLMDVCANNIGDPWVNSNYALNTLEFEREVLRLFGGWMHAPKDDLWGYVTNGGTEGNMYGLYLARELHPEGMVYYSQDTHYSVTKIIHVLGMRSIMIRSQKNGEMDYEDLKESLKIHRDRPPIIFANIGTTMTQAIDKIETIKGILKELAIGQYYLHSDAAFPGSYLPFLEDAPKFDFAAGVHSISVSGHKFIGSPIPCGIALALRSNVQRIGKQIEYIGAMDTTIPGSRNAVTPVILWYALKTLGAEGLKARAVECLAVADYAVEKMNAEGIKAWKNDYSITVVFPRPSERVIRKWSLAPQGDIVHVITVPQVTRESIDALIADVQQDNKEVGAA
jgi:histidine decarboxylase